ncbi:carbonic anhydrase [Roseomonas terrae]|uniref:carbonic anhydrase n=1 Tax=Neoroseomonas terrae TaxID=424799 RepID=A0ABS5EJ96_9PROT|nr:carbonic anhydrase [Neoroseomonas terrae]MBR0651101.1 carbonic anhydrase [Neoroseomonas terrae]
MLPRRSALGALACACTGLLPISPLRAAGPAPRSALSPDQAIARLMEGNRRFVADDPVPIDAGAVRRQSLAAGQAPFASIVCCADSRVAPELLVRAGLGEVFVARVAGNTVPPAGLATIAYGVEALGTPAVMVLGHERCGAVIAAVEAVTRGLPVPPLMLPILAPIIAAVEAVRDEPGDLIDNAVRENARAGARSLIRHPAFAARIDGGSLKVVAARYDLDHAQIELLPV